jgi:hypothetical protein
MPYCRKCGAKLDEDARFCYVCGTPVVPVAATRPTAPKRRRPFYIFPVAILIAVLLSAIVIGALLFLPFTPVNLNQTRQLDSEVGVDHLILGFQADVAQVNVFFENLSGKMLLLNVTASGWTGFLGDPSKSLAVTFYSETINDTVTATSRVSHANVWPSLFSLNVICDVYIDPSARLNLTIHSDVGQITMNASTHITFEELNLDTTTGNVDAKLRQGTTVAGNISIKTTTGSVRFRMDKADVSGNVSVNLQSTIGSVNVDLTENQKLSGNVTVSARTTIGGVDLSMVIDDDVGARIESHADLGEIKVDVQKFSGNQTLLQSDNYPAGSNFLVNLRTTTGGININATYESSVVISATKNP